MTLIRTGRPATLAPNGLVTSPHSLASSAGVDVLRAGGTAVDAAIATSAALSVLYPHMTSVGGDAFWLIWDAKAQQVKYIDGGGRAAQSGTIEAFARRGLNEVPYRGPLPATLTVPGRSRAGPKRTPPTAAFPWRAASKARSVMRATAFR
jgi:gamma-glutamyltranspeptidase/glutathione hydrolase